jgi:sugar lactone lactonase YvrE
VDAAGTIVVADNAGMLNRVLPDGRVFSVAVNNCGNASEIGLCMPHGIAVDVGGAVYTTDDWCRIRRFGGSRPEVTYAGTSTYVDACGFSGDGGPATSAMVAWPYAVAADALGNVFVADTGNHCVRKIDAAGIITTYAGTCAVRARYDVIAGGPGYSGDGGPATAAQLDSPHGVAVDAAGNVYIADTGNFRIRKVSPDGIITTIAGNGSDIALQP